MTMVSRSRPFRKRNSKIEKPPPPPRTEIPHSRLRRPPKNLFQNKLTVHSLQLAGRTKRERRVSDIKLLPKCTELAYIQKCVLLGCQKGSEQPEEARRVV